ncbi:MAG: hypothetical protein IJ337_07535, partial [Clostridia bacterium]|nr:hypothetical protein [Clostridia bacterium]
MLGNCFVVKRKDAREINVALFPGTVIVAAFGCSFTVPASACLLRPLGATGSSPKQDQMRLFAIPDNLAHQRADHRALLLKAKPVDAPGKRGQQIAQDI